MHWLMAHEFMVIGTIFMLVIGPAVGNYACSVVYRLPIGRTPFERHPFCGLCDADLKPIDLYPILSWCMTKGRCRYCRGKIPSIYTVIEGACGLVFVLYFLHFGLSERFILYTAYGVFTVILAAIQWQKGFIAESILGYALTAIALARTLHQHTIYGWFDSGFTMLIICVAIHWLNAKFRDTRFDPFTTPWIWWMVLLGVLVPMKAWIVLIVPALALFAFFETPKKLAKAALIPVATVALFMPLLIHA